LLADHLQILFKVIVLKDHLPEKLSRLFEGLISGLRRKEETDLTRLFTKRGPSQYQPYLFSILLVLLTGCASTQPQSRPFFQPEQEAETHGRKTWYDQVIEADPGFGSILAKQGGQCYYLKAGLGVINL
jgi:hypothetical protein